MKNIFSLSLYIQGLKRVRVVGVAMAVIYTVINSLVAITKSKAESHCTTCCGVCGAGGVHTAEFAPYLVVFPIVAVVISYAMFSYLTRRRSSDFYHALPQKRTALFVSQTLAVLTWCVGILLLSFGVNGAIWGLLRGYNIPFIVTLNTLVWGALSALVFSGCTILGTCLAGTVRSAVFATVTAGALPLFVVVWIDKVLQVAYPYFLEKRTILPYLSGGRFILKKFINVLELKNVGNQYEANELAEWELSGLLSEVAFALILLGVSCLVFSKRKSEIASSSFTGGVYHKIIRTALALPFAMTAVYKLFAGAEIGSAVIWLLWALVAFVLYELVASKSFKTLARALPWFLTVIAACGVVAGSVGLSVAVMKWNDPDDPSEIESVVVKGFILGDFGFLSGEELKDEAAVKAVLQSYPPKDPKYAFSTLIINYKNGKTVYRKYYYSNVTEKALEPYVISIPEFSKQVLSVYEYEELDKNTDKKLWDTFTEEYYKLGIEDRQKVKWNRPDGDEKALNFTVNVNRGGFTTYYVPASKMPDTYKLIEEGRG